MVENISNAISSLKVPNPFRDVILLVSGLSSLLFFEIFGSLHLIEKVRGVTEGRLEGDFAILVLAYAMGRVLRMLTQFLFLMVGMIKDLLLHETTFTGRLQRLWNELRKNPRAYFRRKLSCDDHAVSPSEVSNEISVLELANVTTRFPSLSADIERSVYHLIMIDVTFATLLIAGFTLSIWYLIASIPLGVLAILEGRDILLKEYLIYRSVVKEQNSKA